MGNADTKQAANDAIVAADETKKSSAQPPATEPTASSPINR
jgi:hypothetical protein